MPKLQLPTKEEARARFWEIEAEIQAIYAKSRPMRELRDREVNAAKENLAALKEKLEAPIREVEKDLYDLKQEKSQMAAIAGSYVGEPPRALER